MIVAQKRTYPTSQKRSRARRRCVVIAHNAKWYERDGVFCNLWQRVFLNYWKHYSIVGTHGFSLLSKKNPWVPTMALLVHHTLKGFFRPSTTWQSWLYTFKSRRCASCLWNQSCLWIQNKVLHFISTICLTVCSHMSSKFLSLT